MTKLLDVQGAIDLGREVLEREAECIKNLANTLDGELFAKAVGMLLNCRGRVVVAVSANPGTLGAKLAATLASTGTPAFFVHAAEAAHGDLGMITSEDVVIGISYSGSTGELLTIVPVVKDVKVLDL